MSWISKIWKSFTKSLEKDENGNSLLGTALGRFADSFTSGVSNWWKGFTGSGLTQRDIELNNMNMQNVEDTAAAQVAGYNKAGINSALMYGNGASNSAPQASAAGPTGNMSELIQLLALPSQMKLLDAQAKQTNASANKTVAETQQIKQVMDWYPMLNEATIQELVTKTGLEFANISKVNAETDLAEAEAAIKHSEAKFADRLNAAKVAFEEARTDESKASAAASYARAAMESFELSYAQKHNAKLSSSSILALASAIMKGLGDGAEKFGKAIADVLGSGDFQPTGPYDASGLRGLESLGFRLGSKGNKPNPFSRQYLGGTR